ncbi:MULTISPECIES: thioredoxin-dependent thiol peroxidase [Flavobacteriaceae]|jgi:peroxiredoxin Q/BCP|uniref:thioredoxin-dependent peroxiredoxin n=2 Tax=Flavobacteriaceae TaxID=49546 RepID=A0ABN1JSM5_9FLAO|nr:MULTISPECIES: thioredoxin-dependent thiol peroxidase [Flavobacteriaceae]TBV26762.1 thioredoxin-dependent thiol peroxidase [Meridianimaribacter sp. CL38]TDY12444.1 peroxiredoxin Q/BCP [Meridianimaribacter flavus]
MTKLKAGDKAPDFTAKDEQGNTVSLSDYKGKKLVIFFYPKANTPTCTVEACNLRDNYSELTDKGYEILGVSADTEKRQTNFKNKFSFPYPLLADVDKEVINAFGVWGPKKFMGRTFDGIHRATFVINEDGIIEKVIDKVKAKIHSEQILE